MISTSRGQTTPMSRLLRTVLLAGFLPFVIFSNSVSDITMPRSPSVAHGPQIGCGDIDGDPGVSIGDITFLVWYIFQGGPTPNPVTAADPDCSGDVTIGDVAFLVAYMFQGGVAPCAACPPGTVSDGARLATLDSLEARMGQGDWLAMSQATRALALVPYLKSLQTIDTADITPGSTTVWAHFLDGRLLIIPNNRDTSSADDTLDLPDPTQPPAPLPVSPKRQMVMPSGRELLTSPMFSQAVGNELPSSMQYRAWNAIGTCHVDPIPTIAALLELGNYYAAPNAGPPTVDNFKRVKGDGVFYLNTHGGIGKAVDSVPVMALWTRDRKSAANEVKFKTMLDAYQLAYMTEYSSDSTGACGMVTHYGITNAFVVDFMRFGTNSLIFLDACSSAEPNLVQAFHNSGASVVLCWTNSVTDGFAFKAAKFMYDRLLGVNRIDPKESPFQRPFGVDAIRQDMASRSPSKTVDPSTGAVLTISRQGGDFGMLAPSILFLSIEETPDISYLWVAGTFGTDFGDGNRQVTMNGQPLVIMLGGQPSWGPTVIVCEIPVAGASSAGPVYVQIREGTESDVAPLTWRTSNPVNLTEWKPVFTVTHDEPSTLNMSMTLNVHLRADLHSFREIPHEQPWKTTVLFDDTRAASGSANAGGAHETVGIVDPPCKLTVAYAGSVAMQSPYDFDGQGEWQWEYDGSFDTQQKLLALNLFATAGYANSTITASGPFPDCANFTFPMPAVFSSIDDCLYDEINLTHTLNITMDDAWVILAGSRECPTAPDYSVVYPDGQTAMGKIQWSNSSPLHPPDPDSAR